MRKQLLVLALSALTTLGAQAQLQLTNAGFEEWEEVTYSNKTGEEPVAWSSFLDGTGSMKSMAANIQLAKDAETLRPGTAGAYSAKLTSTSIFGVVAQGNMTNGTINMGSMTATDASGNFNYVSTETNNIADTPRPGHAFTGHPDAFRVWVKYSSTAGKLGQVRALLVTEGYYQDPLSDSNPTTATLVAIASKTDIAHSDEWQELVIPFEWPDTGAEPQYAFISFATCSTPGGGNKADMMWVDDAEMLYYSELTSLSYDGQAVEDNVLPCTPKALDLGKLAVVSGRGAAVSCETADGQLVITIKGEDIEQNPQNEHTYTYSLLPVESKLLGLKYDGQTISGDILPCVKGVFDASLLQAELSVGATYTAELNEEDRLIITVLDENGENPTVYTYGFVTVGSELLTLSYDGKRVYGTVLPCGFSTYDASLLTYTLSEGATAVLGEASEEGVSLAVLGSDFETNPDNVHIYTYTFNPLAGIATDPVEVTPWSEMQQYYADHMDEDGHCDFTPFILNAEMESGEEGWQLNGMTIGENPENVGIASNSLMVYTTSQAPAGESATQTLPGMMAGDYTLGFKCYSCYYGRTLFISTWQNHSSFVSFIDEEKMDCKTASSVATKSVTKTLSEDGDITITVANSEGGSSRDRILVQYDDFTLAYSHPNYKVIAELVKYDRLVAEKNNETFTNMYNNMVKEVRATVWDLADNSENIGVIAEAYNLLSETKHSVFFVSDGTLFQSAELSCGEAVAAPEAEPAKEGHTFKGWNAEIATAMGMEDQVYEAVWEVNQYTVTWTVNGTEVHTRTYEYGATIEGFGYELNPACEYSEWEGYTEGMTMPAHDVTFNMTETQVLFIVTYVQNGVETAVEVKVGEPIVLPELADAGWSWQMQSEDGLVDVPEAMPAQDITLVVFIPVGIDRVLATDSEALHTLSGVRLTAQPRHGLYIRNGKKMIRK